MFEEMLRLMFGTSPFLAVDAIRVGSALGHALADSGCEIITHTSDDSGAQKITAVSPAGMEFALTIDAIGIRSHTGTGQNRGIRKCPCGRCGKSNG